MLRSSRPSRIRGYFITEYLVVLVALMAIWLTADVVLNAVNTYYSNFAVVISQSAAEASR